MLIRFENGSALHLEAAYHLHNPEDPAHQVVLYGDRGGAVAGGAEGWRMYLVGGGEVSPLELEPDATWASTSVAHFVQVLRGECELCPTAV